MQQRHLRILEIGSGEQAISSSMEGGQEGATVIDTRTNSYALHGNTTITPVPWLELRYDIRSTYSRLQSKNYGWSETKNSPPSQAILSLSGQNLLVGGGSSLTSLSHSGAVGVDVTVVIHLSGGALHPRLLSGDRFAVKRQFQPNSTKNMSKEIWLFPRFFVPLHAQRGKWKEERGKRKVERGMYMQWTASHY